MIVTTFVYLFMPVSVCAHVHTYLAFCVRVCVFGELNAGRLPATTHPCLCSREWWSD